MKLTKKRLDQIINEELNRMLQEREMRSASGNVVRENPKLAAKSARSRFAGTAPRYNVKPITSAAGPTTPQKVVRRSRMPGQLYTSSTELKQTPTQRAENEAAMARELRRRTSGIYHPPKHLATGRTDVAPFGPDDIVYGIPSLGIGAAKALSRNVLKPIGKSLAKAFGGYTGSELVAFKENREI